MRIFDKEISRRSLEEVWQSLANTEKIIVVSIFFVLLLLLILFFLPLKIKHTALDTSQGQGIPRVRNDKLEPKGKSLKFISEDAYFISSSSGSITEDQMTVEAVVCIPQDEAGQYNLITLLGETQDIFTSSYTMQENGTIDTSYAMLLNDESYLSVNTPISSNTCHHVAVTAEALNGVCEMNVYTDGTRAMTSNKANNCHLSSLPYKQFIIGSNVHGFKSSHGVIDEVRISDIVRYTQAFTPSTNPFTPDEHTKHLFHFDGDTTDGAGNTNPSGETQGTEFVDTIDTLFPTPTGTVAENFPVGEATPPGQGGPLSTGSVSSPTPTRGMSGVLSPTAVVGFSRASPTPIPGFSGQHPSGDSDTYALPGPPPTSFNQGAKFSYRNQSYVSIDDQRLGLTGSFTVESWVRPIAEPPGFYIPTVIVSKASPQKPYGMPFSLQLGLYLDNIVPYFIVDANNTRYTLLATNGSLRYNQWHHIAATVNSSTGGIRVYVDGNLAGELLVGKPLVIVDPKIATTIGALCLDENDAGYCSRHSLYFNGELDEVRISKVVRYTSNFTPPFAPITADYDTLAIYRFDGNAQDSSGRNNHGGISGSVGFPQSTVGMDDEVTPTPTPTDIPFL